MQILQQAFKQTIYSPPQQEYLIVTIGCDESICQQCTIIKNSEWMVKWEVEHWEVPDIIINAEDFIPLCISSLTYQERHITVPENMIIT